MKGNLCKMHVGDEASCSKILSRPETLGFKPRTLRLGVDSLYITLPNDPMSLSSIYVGFLCLFRVGKGSWLKQRGNEMKHRTRVQTWVVPRSSA